MDPPLMNDYWQLMADMARLQGRLAEDLIAWAKTYQAAGRALEASSHTLGEMAELGRRMEQYMESGPPAVVSQVLRMMTNPWPGMSIPSAQGSISNPFSQFLEAWGPRDTGERR
jgi:hypothetical protein